MVSGRTWAQTQIFKATISGLSFKDKNSLGINRGKEDDTVSPVSAVSSLVMPTPSWFSIERKRVTWGEFLVPNLVSHTDSRKGLIVSR